MHEREDYISWDEFFMNVALIASKRSKDPCTQVGATVVSKDNRILSVGYNGAPNNFSDNEFPWGKEDKDNLNNKYLFVCHAELNAISNYRGNNRDLEGARIYVTLFPCNECAKLIIQNGIKEVIYLSDKHHDKEATKASRILLENTGIKTRMYDGKELIS